MNRTAIIIIVAALVALAGILVYQQSRSTNQQAVEATVVIDEATKAKAVGAAQGLGQQLSGRLMEVMSSEGPLAAIEVCNVEAAGFAESVNEEHGVNIGRTSLKLRNSENVAPEWAVDLMSEDATTPQFVSIDNDTTGAFLPIMVQPQCLVCHGPTEAIAPPVKEQIANFYPDDKATGFSEGDLRGWFWVEVPN